MRKWLPAFSLIISLTAMIAVFYTVDFHQFVAVFQRFNSANILIAAILMTGNLALVYVRFEWTLRILGAGHVNRRLMLFAFATSNLASQFLFSVIGQSLTRATVLQKAGVPVGVTIA